MSAGGFGRAARHWFDTVAKYNFASQCVPKCNLGTRKSIAQIAGWLITFGFLALYGACSRSGGSPSERLPSDQALVKNFEEHRAEFEKLALKIQAEPAIQILNRHMTYPDPLGITTEQLSRYRKSLTELGCEGGLEQSGGVITLRAAGFEYARKGSTKGYYFSSKKPSPLVEDLDRYKLSWADSRAFKAIAENWYLISFINSP